MEKPEEPAKFRQKIKKFNGSHYILIPMKEIEFSGYEEDDWVDVWLRKVQQKQDQI